MEKIEAELSALRARAEMLRTRRVAAEATLSDTKANLPRHHLEAELDADDKVRVKLEAALAAAMLTRDGYTDALADQHAKIAAERAAADRKAASAKLAHGLDKVERALPDFIEAVRHERRVRNRP
jgi:predicted  nucleic acid-binding Zn-ribbon protein